MTTVDRSDVMSAVDEALEAIARSPAGRLLASAEADALEAMRAPIYQSLVAATRHGSLASEPLGRRLRARLYRLREGLADLAGSHGGPGVSGAQILVLPRMATDVRQILPVVDELRRMSLGVDVVATDRAAHRAVDVGGGSSLWGSALARRAIHRSQVSCLRLRVQLGRADWGSAPALGTLCGRDVLALIRGEALNQLGQVMRVSALVRSLLAQVPYRSVVVGNDLTLHGRAATLVARRRGVPSVVIVHGLAGHNPLLAHHCADRVLAWGAAHAQTLQGAGLQTERVVITGSPFLDVLPPREAIPTTLAASYGLRLRTGFVLVALSGPGDKVSLTHHRAIVAAISRAATQLGQPIIVKLHPKDSPEHYDGLGLQLIPAGGADAWSWIAASSCVVTSGSAIALEAMAIGVPVVHIDLEGALAGVDYASAGAAYVATREEEVGPSIRRAIEHGPPASTGEYVSRKLGVLDRQASKRAANIIQRLSP